MMPNKNARPTETTGERASESFNASEVTRNAGPGQDRPDVQQAAADLIDTIGPVTRLRPRSKVPVNSGWQHGGCSPEDFGPDDNIGILLGPVVDADLDDPMARELAREFLPATGAIFGRASSPASHWLYRCSNPGRTRRWTDPDGGCIVELRGIGGQTMAPPSTHPSGERVAWETQGEPANVAWEVLTEGCDDLANAVREAKGEPPKTTPQPEAPPPAQATPRDQRYAEAALQAELAAVRAAGEGARNNQLNTSAVKLGHYVGAGLLDEGRVRGALMAAAVDAGLPAGEAAATIRSGLDAGKAEPRQAPDAAPTGERAVLVRLDTVQPEPVCWLWPQRFPAGKLSIIAGHPGLGKSTAAWDIAARTSRGDGWPDYPVSTSEPGGVVLLSAEDDLADTIRPRLDAAGADVSRIVALTAIKGFDRGKGRDVSLPFDLSEHLPQLEGAIGQVENCRLVIVDPISAFLGATDSHSNSEVRGVLAPLAELAGRRRVAVVGVSHLNKSGGEAVTRIMGSLAFTAAARAVFGVTKDQGDPRRRLFLPVKCNLSALDTGLAYRLVGGAVPHVEWERLPVNISIDQAIGPEVKQRGPSPEQREEAEDFLRETLADGPRRADEVFAEAEAIGITRGTLRRAKEVVGVDLQKDGFQGPWVWSLPGEDGPSEPDPAKGAQPSLPHTT